MRDLGFIISWLVMLPLAFRGAHVGILLWVWTSLLAPNDLLYGIGASVPFAKVAAIPTVLQLIVRHGGNIRFRFGATGFLLLLMAALAVLSQSLSPMINSDMGWELCQKYLKILALGLVLTWVVTNRLRMHAALMITCLGTGFIAVDEGVKFILSGSGHKVLGSPSIGDNNQVALNVLLIIPILQYLYGTASSRALRLACLGTGLLAVVTVIATFSRGGFLGLVIVGGASVLTSQRKLLSTVMLVLALLAGAASVGSDWTARMTTVQAAQEDSSFMGRVVAWKVSTTLAIERPLTGGGFHAIQDPYIWLGQARNFQMLDFVPTDVQGTFARAAHSIYFEMLGDLGFAGLSLFVLLLGTAWRNTGVVRRDVRRSGRTDLAWAADLAGKFRVALLTFMACGSLLSAAYYDIDYLLICLVAALRQIVQTELTASRPSRSAERREVEKRTRNNLSLTGPPVRQGQTA